MQDINRSLIPTSAPDEVLRPAVWSGLTVIWRSASNTPEDIPMPQTGVGISLIGDERARWRIGRGDTQTSRLKAGSIFVFAGEDGGIYRRGLLWLAI